MKMDTKSKYFNLPLFIKSKNIFNRRLLKKNVNLLQKVTFKNSVKNNILFKIQLKSYSGLRHQMKLPVRGQRTKTNAKTSKLRKKLKKIKWFLTTSLKVI